jgi:hypothetical protein
MADPTAPDGGTAYQIGAAAGAFAAALLAWFAALRKKPEPVQFTQAQAFADSDLRTQLLVSQLRESLHSDAEDTRENLRKVLEAHKTSMEHAIDNMERELHARVDDIGERLRELEIAFARSDGRAH